MIWLWISAWPAAWAGVTHGDREALGYEDLVAAELPALAASEPDRRTRMSALEDRLATVPIPGDEAADRVALSRLYLAHLRQIGTLGPAQTWRERAVRQLDVVLERFPHHPEAPEAALLRALVRIQSDGGDDAFELLRRAATDHPESPLAAEAHVRIGERFLDADNPAAALRAYERSGDGRSLQAVFATYKLGWCRVMLGDLARGIDAIEQVTVRVARPRPGQGPRELAPSWAALDAAATGDLLHFYVETRALERGSAYLASHDRPDGVRELLTRLATAYAADGDLDVSTGIWRQAILLDPKHPDNPTYQYAIVENATHEAEPERLDDERTRLGRDYGPASAWRRVNADNAQAIGRADALILRAESL